MAKMVLVLKLSLGKKRTDPKLPYKKGEDRNGKNNSIWT